MNRYIVSTYGCKLTVTQEAPRIVNHGEKSVAGWHREGSYFDIKRRQLEEFTSPFTGRRMIARVMPQEMYAEHEGILERIANAKRELASAEREEQDFLEALAPRARKVRVAT